MAECVQTESGYSTTINDETGPYSEEEGKPRMTHAYYCDLVFYYFDDIQKQEGPIPTAQGLVEYLEEQYKVHIEDERQLDSEPEYYI